MKLIFPFIILMALNACTNVVRETPIIKDFDPKLKIIKPSSDQLQISNTEIEPSREYGFKNMPIIDFNNCFDTIELQSIYPNECESFFEFLKENHALINQTVTEVYSLNPEFVLAVASPEIAWFSSCKDRLETLAVEAFYMQLGKDYADFSLGLFQMKPSFIEDLEKELTKYPKLKKYEDQIRITGETETDIRSERISRLKQSDRQLNYLCIFCLLMNEKHEKKQFKTETDKVKFYAAAYNRGFLKNDSDILNSASLKLFPSGKKSENNYRYIDIAAYFYNNMNFNPLAYE